MRQQRYALQTKNKINPQKINETGISNLPCKELKVVIIKMLNKLERRIDEQSENIKENIRMSQNLKSTISELKNTIKKVKSLSYVRFFATSWTVAYQAPLSMGFSRQEYWSGLPCSPPGDLPDPGREPAYLPAMAGRFFNTSPPRRPMMLFSDP